MKGGWYGRSSSNGSYAAKGIFAPVLYVLYSALNINLYPALCSQPTSINMFANVWNWLEIRSTSEEKSQPALVCGKWPNKCFPLLFSVPIFSLFTPSVNKAGFPRQLLFRMLSLFRSNVQLRNSLTEKSLAPLLKHNENAEGDCNEDGRPDGVGGVVQEGDQDRGQDVLLHSW